jgi:pimeloyl-ACP methyl ester carboxylesterase
MKSVQHLIPNHDGWLLALTQSWDPERLAPNTRPLVIIPGYAMNSFIYSYHPHGVSLEGCLVEAGLEVWRADLRAQGGAVRTGGTDDYALEDLALADVGAAVTAVLERTRTKADRVDALGGSLGGTLMFAHAVLREDHRLATMVCMGTPVRWVKSHPLLRFVLGSPTLVGMVPLKGTRRFAEIALPIAAKLAPWLLSIYLNPEITDVGAAREMTRSVEDPNRHVSRQIARWVRDRDLILDGVNIGDGLRELTNPLLCIYARGDGVVPPETASFPYEQIGSKSKRLVEVGSPAMTVAHADMFVSSQAHEQVFHPIRDWLLEQQGWIP